ncbi:MAG: hypothetical protein ACR2OM_12390, partial [Aestuariivirgaceae bacterium]
MTATRLDTLKGDQLALRQPESADTPWQLFDNAADVAARRNPELPVLCFAPTRLSASAKLFKTNFPGNVAYAVKANSSIDAIMTIAASGITMFDVASLVEMKMVRAACPHAEFHYHNPVKSRNEITRAYSEYGCIRFAADHPGEINKIAECLGRTSGIEIAIRFRLPAHGRSVHDFSTKFGATPPEASELLAYADKLGFTGVLTFHPGSQCTDPGAWRRHIHTAAEIAGRAGVTLAALNVGGGFPARYVGTRVADLDSFFTAIGDAADEAFGRSAAPVLECEPGRGIVAPAQSLLTRVKLVKPERREIFINDGIYGALMEVSQAPDIIPPCRAIRPCGEFVPECNAWTVYGPTCDPLDTLPVSLALPRDIREDD